MVLLQQKHVCWFHRRISHEKLCPTSRLVNQIVRPDWNITLHAATSED